MIRCALVCTSVNDINYSLSTQYKQNAGFRSKQIGSPQNNNSVQETSKKSVQKFGKTDSRYWNSRLFKNSFTRDGERHETADWCLKVGFGGRRETINLRTPNKSAAASKAAGFYKDLIVGGWDFAIGKLRPETLQSKPAFVSVGQLIEVATKLSSARLETLDVYTKALRRLTAGVMGIDDGRKHNALGQGTAEWRSRVDATDLAKLTPAAVHAWKNSMMNSAQTNEKRGKTAITLNSILRNSKALVSKKIKPFVAQELKLPEPLWFEGISTESEPTLRYRSKIQAEKIIEAAKAEMFDNQPELFKLLLLTLVCGLRRSEADTLLWSQVDLKKGIISIHDTEVKRLKSKDSAGDIALDSELVPLFKTYRQEATGIFVLETPIKSRIKGGPRKGGSYRCDATEKALIDWLKKKGVPGPRPIHTLRKEIGSIIASRDGIFKASRYLRHSDIRITSKLYADTKTPVSAGLGSLFIK
jgi:integrase